MKTFLASLILLCYVAVPFPPAPASPLTSLPSIPSGTAFPVALHGTLSSKRAQPGQILKARIMQEIPLREEGNIRAGTYVQGKIISVTPAARGIGARISFQFDQLLKAQNAIPITTTLRALASGVDITSAQIPKYDDHGSSPNANTTFQVGGEVVFRGGGHVMDRGDIVAEPIYGNGVVGRLRPSLDGTCEGAIEGNDQVQALWLFSTDACGVYGYSHVKIVHAGRTSPVGEVVLISDRGDITIHGGAGMLLRVVHAPTQAAGF